MKHAMLVGMLVGAVATGAVYAGAGAQAPTGETDLGSVTIPRSVMADGKRLGAGTYDVRLTAQRAMPDDVVGQGPDHERWVEFVQGGEVAGREVASAVIEADLGEIRESAPPGRGSSRVEMLKENEYLRVWINRDGVHYLIHLSVS